ncbi:pyruvate dehydrogenase E2 component (dihydrolipoamide acetyltransferase) [Lipingzhangella halophila]|uniref:Pyruvate dehydrogenase E2 component (Dihydrolipoamide acetyltransferase) n=1 Tax=Lipingzhangella halophila TaxID=1783352 RepID=A0A7W7W208_9ACTN|nr:biotin/lipoyl-containing protein [Lipingzhangella halophila]MBB4930210.1 pyruvate dehydrogenase E2 component (dihydrolipoamide acetyltransferase) [Lipingzhangella halophila]
MAEQTFTLPDLGEGLTEATILEWRVGPGAGVARNQPLVEVETTKSAVEIPSPHAGVIAELHAEEGEVVRVGAALVTFDLEQDSGIVGTVPDEEERSERRVRLRPPAD